MTEYETLPPLADLGMLASLGISGDPAQLAAMLDAASAAARQWCGWAISEQKHVELEGRPAGTVTTLPTLWLVDVEAFTVDGYDHGVPEFNRAGVVHFPAHRWQHVVATVTHGYDPVPADIALAVANMVGRALAVPVGIAGERLGAWSVTYNRVTLAVDDSAVGSLTPYRLPAVP